MNRWAHQQDQNYNYIASSGEVLIIGAELLVDVEAITLCWARFPSSVPE